MRRAWSCCLTVFWQNSFSGRPDVIGETMTLDGERATVVGVLPRIPGAGGFFVPMALDTTRDDRNARTLFVMARLRDGATIESARAEWTSIGLALERELPATNRGWAVNTRPLQEEFVGPQARLVFALLAGTVLTVLLIGCVNIANLLLARGAARRGELAVRVALGAGGWRVVRQLLVECAVLAILGGLLSIAVSRWTIQPADVAGRGRLAVGRQWRAQPARAAADGRGLGAGDRRGRSGAGVRLRVAKTSSPLCATTGRSGVGGAGRTTRVLVAAQVALAVTLLVMAGLVTRTLIALEQPRARASTWTTC